MEIRIEDNIPNFLLCDHKKSNKYMYDILRFSGASASLSESIALSDSIVWRTGDSNFQCTEVLNSLKGFQSFSGACTFGIVQDFAKTQAHDLKRMAGLTHVVFSCRH